MRLALDTEVVALAGIGVSSGASITAGAALDATGSALADKLGTPLSAQGYVDACSYIVPRFQSSFAEVRFRLTAGFIDADTFVFRMSSNGLIISTATDGETVPADRYDLDPVNGILTLLAGVTTGRQRLIMAYDAGFSADPSTKVGANLPDWLKQAGIVSAVKLVSTAPLNTAKQKSNMYKEVQSALQGEASAILNPHIRPVMGMVWPDKATIEA